MPGRQTVPRGELWGAIQILSRVDEMSNIQIPIDANYVTRGIPRRGDLEQGPNGESWSILFQLIDECSGVTEVIKVKSHLEDVGPSVITQNKIGFHHMLANSLADVVAEQAAKRLLPDLNLEGKAKKADVSELVWPNAWRWYMQTYGENVVQQATSTNSSPWW